MKHISKKQKIKRSRLLIKRYFREIIKRYKKALRDCEHNETSKYKYHKKKLEIRNADLNINIIIRNFDELKSRHPLAKIIEEDDGTIKVIAPEEMSLKKNKDEVFDFLKSIRDLTRMRDKKQSVDFVSIKSLSILCAMLLTSEIDRWEEMAVKRLRVRDDIAEWDPVVRKLLNNFGLFDLVTVINKPEKEDEDPEEKFIPIFSGRKSNYKEAKAYIKEKVTDIAVELGQNREIYGAISEATTNVVHWAYDESVSDIFATAKEKERIKDRWWFSISYNIKSGIMNIMVCDHGVGIPDSLRKSKKFGPIDLKFISSLIKNKEDHQILKDIMNSSEATSGEDISSTKKSHRGRGLREMKTLLTNFKEGKLRIISGKGEYEFRRENGKNLERSIPSDYSIAGTVITWELYPNSRIDE